MNVNTFQSLLNLNANEIAAKHAMYNHCVQEARKDRLRGEQAFMIDWFKKASKYRKQLAKLHATQHQLYAELKALYTSARVRTKVRKLNDLGYPAPACSNLTGFQYEAELDKLITTALRAAA